MIQSPIEQALRMPRPWLRSCVLGSLVAAGLATAVLAQDGPPPPAIPGVTQENLARAALVEFAGSDIVSFNGVFAPSATSGRHRHPGTEVVHVVSGTGVLLQDGREPVELRPGVTVVSEPAAKGGSFIHELRNLSPDEPLRTYIVLLVDTGEPPFMPPG
jgi:quercetin dioxygenase-like cupin family protein